MVGRSYFAAEQIRKLATFFDCCIILVSESAASDLPNKEFFLALLSLATLGLVTVHPTII